MALNVGIAVMAKLPSAGEPKTRLRGILSREERQALQAALLEDALARVRSVCRGYLAFSPPEAIEEAAAYGGADLFPDTGADLGEKMARAMEQLFGRGHDAAIVVGTDCPYLSPDDLDDVIRQLREVDVSLGPALDGGYYLIGLRSPHPRIFAEVPWGSPSTLAVTIERIREAGLTCKLTRPLPDVDTPEDFLALVETATRHAPRTVHSPRVQALLRSWRHHFDRAAP